MKSGGRVRHKIKDWIANALKEGERLSKQEREQQHKYYERLQETFTKFQLVEEGLKAYLGKMFSVIRSSLEQKGTFRYTRKDVEKMSLGNLLRLFEKFNDNTRLHKRINDIKDNRNHYAHRGYLLYFGTKDDIYKELDWLKQHIGKCERLNPILERILRDLIREIKKIRA